MRLGDIFQARQTWELDGQTCYTSLNFRAIATTDDALLAGELAALNLYLSSNIWSTLRSEAADAVTFREQAVKPVVGRSPPMEFVSLQNVQGQQVAEALPGTIALPFHLRTDYAGRQYRGRMHWGGLSEAQSTAGRLSAAGLVSRNYLLAALNGIIANAHQQGFKLVVFSRTRFAQAHIPNTEPTEVNLVGSSPAVTRITVSDILGTMRSRKIGVGA